VRGTSPGAAVDDDTFVALRFQQGVIAHLWMSVLARQPGPRFRVYGTRGTFEKWDLDPQEEALRTGMRPGDPGWVRSLLTAGANSRLITLACLPRRVCRHYPAHTSSSTRKFAMLC